MSDNTYNGWANYATWRVNLELIDDNWDYWSVSLEEMEGEDEEDIQHTMTKEVEEYVEAIMDMNDPGDPGTGVSTSNLIRSYANAFLADVSYHQIAKNLIEQYELEKQES